MNDSAPKKKGNRSLGQNLTMEGGNSPLGKINMSAYVVLINFL
jgi:hypothetical protein